MSEILDNAECPRCGSPVPPDAPGGQCPKCLLGAVAAASELPVPPPVRGEWPALEEVRAAFPELEIESEIGRGGMAAVFRARQRHLDRLVALKVLVPWLAAEPGFAGRFSREARVLAKLNHPNIVTIHDFGQAGRFFYLLMEYVDGVSLRQAMQAGRFAPAQVLGLVPKICDALQYAHGEGVLHRDIKPDNILLDARGRVKIADFGIAKLAGEGEPAMTLTRSGMRLGTPAYMAPEQVEKPGDVDHRADIYSLGVVLYEMLTGELPLGRFAAPSEKASVDERIDEIVFRTLEKERERRYQSAEEVKTRVEGLGGPPLPPQPAGPGEGPAGHRAAGGVTAPGGASMDDPLSRKAVAGAVATGLSLCGVVVLVPAWTVSATRVSHGPMDPPPGAGGETVVMMVLLMVLLAGLSVSMLSGILLGASALSDIHRSGGRRRGAGLAAFAALAWPLMILTGAGAGLCAKLGEVLFDGIFRVAGREWLKGMVFLSGLGAVLWLDATLIRRVLLWARGVGEPRPAVPSPMSAATVAGPAVAPAVGSVSKTSGLALAGGIVILVSLMPVVLLWGILWFPLIMAGGLGGAGVGLGTAEIVIAVFASGVPGLVGTILGVMGMRAIREGGGRLSGAGWAVLGGLGWLVVLVFGLGLALGAPVARGVPGVWGGMLSALLGLGLPALAAGRLFRAGLAWTTGGATGSVRARGASWPTVLFVLAAAIQVRLAVMRDPQGRRGQVGEVREAHSGMDVTRAEVVVRHVELRAELRPDAAVPPLHRLDLTLSASMTGRRKVEIEYWRRVVGERAVEVALMPESRIVSKMVMPDSRMVNIMGSGAVLSIQRELSLEIPEGAGEDVAQEAVRQIINGWLNQSRTLRLDRPERLFEIGLPGGDRLEAVVVQRSAIDTP